MAQLLRSTGDAVRLALQPIETLLFQMLPWYDKYMYGPLSVKLSPHVARIPRYAQLNGQQYTVFTANILSSARAAMVVIAAMFLKFQFSVLASLIVFFHDFLDHVDGMVAREQKKIYGQIDDPVLGGFMDAFCDKIFNCLCLWSLLMAVETQNMSNVQLFIFLLATCSILIYEFILGVVRVQDYFHISYCQHFGSAGAAGEVKIAANMAGKLKEKLESFGLAFLCMASSSSNIMTRPDGILGVVLLLLSVRLAHSSLAHKLERRSKAAPSTGEKNQLSRSASSSPVPAADASGSPLSDEEKFDVFFITQEQQRTEALQIQEDEVVNKVFTIGCFDLFHFGHEKLLRRMRRLGQRLIIGVHSDESIQTLKKKTPIDSLETRMKNVRKHADQVFCIHSTDPSAFFQCIVDLSPSEKALYVRGNDMVNFPARNVVEQLMPVRFLPYTEGISSTILRKRFYSQPSLSNGSIGNSSALGSDTVVSDEEQTTTITNGINGVSDIVQQTATDGDQ
eukprot:scpid43079/ scgid23073/ 